MTANTKETPIHKIAALASVAAGFALIGSLGWPLGGIGAAGAFLMAYLQYKTPQLHLELKWPGIKRRPLLAMAYVLSVFLLGGSVVAFFAGL